MEGEIFRQPREGDLRHPREGGDPVHSRDPQRPGTLSRVPASAGMTSVRTALILLGHGSHLNPDSSAPVYAHAERIRASGRFDQVLEAFWKEEPSLRDAIDLAEAERVIVVPLFLAEGYFTRQVLPRELGLDGPMTARRGRTIVYTAPIGTHPGMAGMIAARAQEAFAGSPSADGDTALLIIGHGTERSATSGDTVYELVDELRGRGEFGEVACGFLDEAPKISEVLAGVQARSVVLVPFFIAEGWHTRETIPADLGLTGDVTRRGEQTIWYTAPVGTLPGVADVVMELAAEACFDPDADAADAAVGPCELRDARAELLARLDAEGELRVMQIVVRRTAPGRYEVRHVEDAGTGSPEGQGAPPHALRRAALELVRFNEAGDYRPLRSAPDLRRGWAFVDLDPEQLWELLSAIYPAAVLHAHRLAGGTLEIVDFAPWAARQTAMYAGLGNLPLDAVTELTRSICQPCRRTRLWRIQPRDNPAMAPSSPHEIAIPCREPCTVFATAAREILARGSAVGDRMG